MNYSTQLHSLTNPVKLKLNDFLELEISVSVKVVQVCIGHLMTEHSDPIIRERNHTFSVTLYSSYAVALLCGTV